MIPLEQTQREKLPVRILLHTLREKLRTCSFSAVKRGIWTILLGFAVAMLPAEPLAPLGIGYMAAHLSAGFLPQAAAGTLLGYLLKGEREALLFGGAALCLFAIGEFFKIKNRPVSQVGRMCAAALATLAPGLGAWMAERTLSGFVLLNARLLLCAGATVIFETALSITEEKPAARDFSRLLVCGAVLTLLARVPLAGGMSVGTLAGAFLTCYAGLRGKNGAKTGLLLGLVTDLAVNSAPCYTVVWGVAGLMGSLFLLVGVWGASLCFLVSGSFAALWTVAYPGAAAMEICISGVIGSLLLRKNPALRQYNPPRRMQAERLAEELERRAGALEEVVRQLTPAEETKKEWLRPLLYDLREQVCAGCPRAKGCPFPTAEKLGVLLCRCAPGGRLLPENLPEDVRRACPSPDAVAGFLDRGLTLRLYREQLRGSRAETRRILRAQYEEFAQMLKSAAEESRHPLSAEVEKQSRLNGYLKKQGIQATGQVYRDGSGALYAELRGKDLSLNEKTEKEWRDSISRCLRAQMEITETAQSASGGRITLRERRGLILEAEGVSAHAPGQRICGDVTEFIRLKNGERVLLISDGMGHGAEAQAEARRAITILKGNLRAGMEPELAIRTLLSALFARQGGDAFATVDMFRFNALSGEAWFYKCGGAPTWLCRSGKTEKIDTGGLPAGADLGLPYIRKEKLSPGDWVLLLSDGITDGEGDGWIESLLLRNRESTAGQMASAVLSERPDKTDDGTVIAIRIKTPAS